MKIVGQPDPSLIEHKSVTLPPSDKKKTIIFDLDETLVHCIDDIDTQPYDLPLSVKFSTGETIEAGINIRPFAYDCLKTAHKNYRVLVFTASHQAYADAVLDAVEQEFKKPEYLTFEEQAIVNKASSLLEKRKIIS